MNRSLANTPQNGWMIKGKLFPQPYAYMDVLDWLQAVYKECPKLKAWVSENQTVDKEALANRICEILDDKFERV